VKNTSDEDDINHIVAYGLILIAVIGILGLIGIAALWGPQTDLTANQNVGPIVVITSAAVGALAGVLSTRVLASPLTQDIPRWAMHAAVCTDFCSSSRNLSFTNWTSFNPPLSKRELSNT